jgi:CRISPR/Cas system-associated endoribonuclease Cas2
MQPYLTAKDKMQRRLYYKGAGLKLPVILRIEKMRQMLDFEFRTNHDSNEALIGHKFQIDIYATKLPNVDLKSLRLTVEKVESDDVQSIPSTVSMGHPDAHLMQSIDLQSVKGTAQHSIKQSHGSIVDFTYRRALNSSLAFSQTIKVQRKKRDTAGIIKSQLFNQSIQRALTSGTTTPGLTASVDMSVLDQQSLQNSIFTGTTTSIADF